MRRIGLLFGQNYLVAVLGILAAVISARGLSVENRGELAVVMLAAQLLSRLGGLGFEPLIYKEGTPDNLSDFYLSNFVGVLLISPIIFLMGVLDILGIWGLVSLLVCSAMISVLRINLASLLSGDKIKEVAYINVVQAIAQISFYAIAFTNGKLMNFFIAWLCAVMISTVVSLLFVKIVLKKATIMPKFINMVGIWKSGLRYAAVALPEIMFSFSVEIPIIRHVAGDRLVGLYAIAVTFNSLIYQAFSTASSVIIRFGRERVMHVYAVIILMSIILMVLSPALISAAFGQSYMGAYRIFQVTMPMALLLGIMRVEYIISGYEVPRSVQMYSLLALFLLICMGSIFDSGSIIYWISTVYCAYSLFYIYLLKRKKS